MSVQNLPPNPETDAEPEDLTVRRLVRAIDYAEGFWLGFAKSNTPAQRRRLAALCRDLLEPLKIRVLEIELNEPVTDLLPVLRERLAQEAAANNEDTTTGEPHEATRPKLAIFVYGLERSIPSREAYPPLLSALNLKRELFRQEVPHPLLLWLPDYALTALARKAPDFWAWRSGLYEFPPERDAAEQSLKTIRGEAVHVTESLSERAKRKRLVMLKGLMEDYRELGDGSREQEARAYILEEIGLVHSLLGEYAEAKQALGESLAIFRKLGQSAEEAIVLNYLGHIAQSQEEVAEAERLHNESLQLAERSNSQNSIGAALYYLGMLKQDQNKYEEARLVFNKSMQIAKKLNNQGGVATILFELGRMASNQGDVREARRLYTESLEIEKKRGNHRAIAGVQNNLGMLVEYEGDKVGAARLYREALITLEKLGAPDAEIARRNLARVESH